MQSLERAALWYGDFLTSWGSLGTLAFVLAHQEPDVSSLRSLHEVLRAAGVKVIRAVDHAQALEDAVESFLEEHPYRVVVDFEHEVGCHVGRIRVEREPPLWLSAIVGDIIHNLRSALDHVAWQMALEAVGEKRARKERRRITFPITTDPKDFRCHTALPFFTKDAIAVLEYMQPYKRRHVPDDVPTEGEPLALINELSKTDKHQNLVGMFAELDLAHVRFRAGAIHIEDFPASYEFLPIPETFEDGTEIVHIRFPGFGPPETTKVDVTQQPSATIHFGPGLSPPMFWGLCSHAAWVLNNSQVPFLIPRGERVSTVNDQV